MSCRAAPAGTMGDVELWIAGAGGVWREALDVAMAAGIPVAGFVDDRHAGSAVRDLRVVGPGEVPGGSAFLVGIGDPSTRLRVADRMAGAGLTPASLVHPRAIVGPATEIGLGCLIAGGAHVSSSVTLASHVQVHYNATIGHDCVLDEGATVLPGANVAGAVRVGGGATVGSGAVVLQGLSVGDGATVGAGAVVTRDVAPGAVVVGSPARALHRSPSSG